LAEALLSQGPKYAILDGNLSRQIESLPVRKLPAQRARQLIGASMKIQILESSPEAAHERQYASCYLINGSVAIDAGPLGLWGTPQQQAAVRHIFLTHTHIDHIATLPIFLENAWDPSQDAVVLHGNAATLQALRTHILNDIVWPDFVRISPPERPFLQLLESRSEQVVEVEGLRVLPVEVNHIVPTFGYVITNGRSTVIFGADSGPTQRIWELASEMPEPRSVFLEASFPNSMGGLAKLAGHLTPEMLGREVSKMPRMENVIAVHIKAKFCETIQRELNALGITELVLGEGGKTYEL
jgi:ribonuclease BN (tRNA processing enzyme)